MKKVTFFGFAVLAATILLAGLFPRPVVAAEFDRGLPSANLNNAAGPLRSNVAWADTEANLFYGDDFSIGSLGDVWIVDKIRTWSVQGRADDVGYELGDDFASFQLYAGVANSGIALLASGNLAAGSHVNSNPSITHTKVGYPDGTPYHESGSSTLWQMWETDFANLNWSIQGGTLYQIGVRGIPQALNSDLFFLHASNGPLSGSPQQGSDGKFLIFDINNLAAAPVAFDSNQPGVWDKSSDINLQVWAHKLSSGSGNKRVKLRIINRARVYNRVNVSANTGHNTINRNTGGNATITTGNATTNVTVNNTVNTNNIVISQ